MKTNCSQRPLSLCSQSVLVETRVVHCVVKENAGDISIDFELPELAEVIRRKNRIPHTSDVGDVKVVTFPSFSFG